MSDSKNEVEQATEIVKSIPEFMQALTEVLQTPWGWLFLAVIVVWFIVNRDLSNVLNLFELGESRRLEKLESYVSNKSVADESALSVMKDLRDAYYFKVATGIYAERILRDCLISLHNVTSHTINWRQIKRALPYIKASHDMKISIREMSVWENVGHYYNIVVGFLFLFIAVAIFFVFMISESKSIINVFVGLGGAATSAIFAMFVFSLNWPYASAKFIQKEINTTYTPSNDVKNND